MKRSYMYLSFNQLWYVIKTIELGSFSKAAKALNVTQSTLSKSVQNMEQTLNLEIFTRDRNNLIPTEAGMSLYRSWIDILKMMEESVEIARYFPGGMQGALKIGVLNSHKSEAYLWEYTECFRKKYPNISLMIESDTPDSLHKKLIENELDVIFTVRYDVETLLWEGHHIEIVKDTPLTVCMRRDNPKCDKEEWEVKDLKDCNLIVISALHVPSYNSMLVELCLRHGFFPNIIYNARSANSQVYNLAGKNDVFVCDKYHIDNDSNYCISRPLKDTHSGVAMVWRNEEKPYLKDFVDMVLKCESKEIEKRPRG